MGWGMGDGMGWDGGWGRGWDGGGGGSDITPNKNVYLLLHMQSETVSIIYRTCVRCLTDRHLLRNKYTAL